MPCPQPGLIPRVLLIQVQFRCLLIANLEMRRQWLREGCEPTSFARGTTPHFIALGASRALLPMLLLGLLRPSQHHAVGLNGDRRANYQQTYLPPGTGRTPGLCAPGRRHSPHVSPPRHSWSCRRRSGPRGEGSRGPGLVKPVLDREPCLTSLLVLFLETGSLRSPGYPELTK